MVLHGSSCPEGLHAAPNTANPHAVEALELKLKIKELELEELKRKLKEKEQHVAKQQVRTCRSP